MFTHYYRKSFKNMKPFVSVQDSIVFNSIPYEKLVCIDDITKLAVANKENEGVIRNQKDVEAVLKGLVENGWVGEAYSVKLEKWLQSLK